MNKEKDIDKQLGKYLSPNLYCYVHNYIVDLKQQITQLTNNWNELEDAIDNEVNYYIEDEDAEWFEAKKIQNIMKEISGGK